MQKYTNNNIKQSYWSKYYRKEKKPNLTKIELQKKAYQC